MGITRAQLTNLNRFRKSKLDIATYALIGPERIAVKNIMPYGALEYSVPHGWDLDGSSAALVPTEELVKIARKLDITKISRDEADTNIHSAAGSFSFQTPEATEFPDLATKSGDYELPASTPEIPGATLDRLSDYMSSDSLRPAMCGVFLSAERREATATDGHHMEWIGLADIILKDEIIPADVMDLIDKKTTYLLDQRSRFSQLTGGGETICWEHLDEKYPLYHSVIPDYSGAPVATLDLDKTITALEAAKVGMGKHSILTLYLGESVHFSAVDDDLEKTFTSASIGTYDGEETQIGFSTEKLTKAMKRRSGGTVQLFYAGPKRALRIGQNEILMPYLNWGSK